jgi:Mannose-6-phosphate isomerase
VAGQGRTIIDGMEQIVRPGDTVTIAAGCVHTILADTDMDIIEIQVGEEISIDDKREFPLPE